MYSDSFMEQEYGYHSKNWRVILTQLGSFISTKLNRMFAVRIFLSGVDAKFDAKCNSRAEAEQIQEHVESIKLDGLEVIILPPKDGGKTSGVHLKCQETAPS